MWQAYSGRDLQTARPGMDGSVSYAGAFAGAPAEWKTVTLRLPEGSCGLLGLN